MVDNKDELNRTLEDLDNVLEDAGSLDSDLNGTIRDFQEKIKRDQGFLEALEVSERRVADLKKEIQQKNYILLFLIIVIIALGILFVLEGGYLAALF